jgi:glutathione S-transferase
MSEIILHNYPQSPIAERVRVGLGLKGLSWNWVEIPRLPPKPDLMPLTGGYRRTPVMQIGADIYCDSTCILRKLERRFPEPTFFPASVHGGPWGLGRWADGFLFDLAIRLVVITGRETMPAEWIEDRSSLYFGPSFDLAAAAGDIPHIAAQLRGQMAWVDQRLTGQNFMLGDNPGLADLFIYPTVWIIRARWDQGPALFSQFPAIEAWEARVAAIGHGDHSDMESGEALEIAKASDPETPENTDSLDPQALKPGMRVGVQPIGSSIDKSVEGQVRAADAQTIAIDREDDRVGKVCVHFPRVGYRVTPL